MGGYCFKVMCLEELSCVLWNCLGDGFTRVFYICHHFHEVMLVGHKLEAIQTRDQDSLAFCGSTQTGRLGSWRWHESAKLPLSVMLGTVERKFYFPPKNKITFPNQIAAKAWQTARKSLSVDPYTMFKKILRVFCLFVYTFVWLFAHYSRVCTSPHTELRG